MRFGYLFSILLIFALCISTLSSCSKKTGCPALGTKPTKKEKKRGGKSNLFDKKTRRKIGYDLQRKGDKLEVLVAEEEWCE